MQKSASVLNNHAAGGHPDDVETTQKMHLPLSFLSSDSPSIIFFYRAQAIPSAPASRSRFQQAWSGSDSLALSVATCLLIRHLLFSQCTSDFLVRSPNLATKRNDEKKREIWMIIVEIQENDCDSEACTYVLILITFRLFRSAYYMKDFVYCFSNKIIPWNM